MEKITTWFVTDGQGNAMYSDLPTEEVARELSFKNVDYSIGWETKISPAIKLVTKEYSDGSN
jgi:hypothetical protein